MHNESKAQPTAEPQLTELPTPSTLSKIKSNAIAVGIYAIPTVTMAAAAFFGAKTGATQSIAKLGLDAAAKTASTVA